mgnify:CR=1 FL=1
MAKKNRDSVVLEQINCACLIHGVAYGWNYVDRLYNMLTRNLSQGVKLHVFTEPDRNVPAHMIKHELKDLGVSGPKQAWWYKLQIFNSEHYSGPLLYFDLDTVIVRNIDWAWQQDLNFFWGIRDFKCLWKPTDQGINSSVMWWDTTKFDWIWQNGPAGQLRSHSQTRR